MKTLNRAVTAAFYRRADGYWRLGALWSEMMQDRERRKTLTAAHHLLYLILRGKDWQKAFAPVTSPVKLANGGFYNWGAKKAVNALHAEWYTDRLPAPFADLITKEAICAIRALVPPLEWNESPLEREPYDG